MEETGGATGGETILEVSGLDVTIRKKKANLFAVRDVCFSLREGTTLGVVGESGSGKSMTALAVMRLLAEPVCRISRGEALFQGRDLRTLSPREMRAIRGNNMAMIFQEPMTSLNPVLTIGYQIQETLLCHEKISPREARSRCVGLLEKVGIPLPEQRLREYPYQLSGGMRQRVMIAMALACHPRLLICDEPTTALDVTIQSQILSLINELKKETRAAVMLITHDMGIIGEMADQVLVMYAGMVMEYAAITGLLEEPLHPYTAALIDSIPSLTEQRETLREIPGSVPSLDELPPGCLFHTRCAYCREICRTGIPGLTSYRGRTVRCWKYTPRWER
ncbi:MAG: ABC transporter ATP-binding protein [Spirochaetaceae bacterium]|jgi:peptide/nickel transport system ATP-binding protein/oligopeptide transport system ATP-binding protein|nr:ABC transporter ATP-binding protein [Spirochaetaceae bacterium]